jgi:site-specific recombinase XerD
MKVYNSNVKKPKGALLFMSTIKVTAEVKQEIDHYRQFMLEHEYTSKTALGYSTYLSRFLRLSPHKTVDFLKESITAFLETQRECNSPGVFKECRAALRLYYKMVTGKSFSKHPPKVSSPEIELALSQFYDHSINIKRTKSTTALGDVSFIRSFLECLAKDTHNRLDSITAHDIRDFVVERLTHLSDSTKGSAVTAMRNFFRYRKFEGFLVHESIFLLPLSPAVWKNAAFPTTIDQDIFRVLSEVPNQNTPSGKRDYCIMLCFTELALRCIEVAALTIDNFNWHEGYVSIQNTKTHSDRRLPITEKLGQAVIEYIQSARPKTIRRELFVRFKRKCGEPMGCSQIRGVVRRVYGKGGADIKSTGTHILRRTAGSQLYNSGNSLKLTADILGHESLNSTVRYTKADIVGIRQVAAPWPGVMAKAGVQNVL